MNGKGIGKGNYPRLAPLQAAGQEVETARPRGLARIATVLHPRHSHAHEDPAKHRKVQGAGG